MLLEAWRSNASRPGTAERRAIITSMEIESSAALLAAFAQLPAAAPLLPRLGDADGVHLVGGALRDLMLGGAPVDLDFVVDGDLGAVVDRIGAHTVIHDRFGTCTVRLDRFHYDFARARRETYPRPGALPLVTPATLEDDLGRRDFTVNAMALAVGARDGATLRSVDRARQDLARKWLRVLHDASFIDDPTRLLRLARYAARLGFAVEPHTLELARIALADRALDTVSGTRLGSELRLCAREGDPAAAFEHLRGLGVDEALAPGFGLSDPALARRALALLPPDGDRATLVLAAASLRLAAVQLGALLDRLGFAAAQRDAIIAAATGAAGVGRALERAGRPSEIAAAVGDRARPELVALAGAMGPADAARQWLERLRQVRLEIDGSDLLGAGVPAGPAIGSGLRGALAAKLDGRVAGRGGELAEAVRIATGTG
jgi:tRNA nucleotidyltransferase (CCA-adding enzyme)